MAIYDLPGKTFLSHNRHGIRIEFNLNQEGLLELWLSPKAATSNHYFDRNFSNRDDHTRLFDRIALPGLSLADFKSCDYDPFYIVLHFKAQTLHLVSLFDAPAVALWFDQPATVDFKSDKADTLLSRDSRHFAVEHPDRGYNFHYAAAINQRGGQFTHQLVLDRGRSTYARAELAAGQLLVIAGELDTEGVLETAQKFAALSPTKLLQNNERQIEKALEPGSFQLRGNPKLQNLLDINRRVLLCQQDVAGAIRAALNRIYYLIWARDGAIIECFQAYSGDANPVQIWTDFLLANPTVIEEEEPKGRTFLMLVNGKITKWEEDGIFYAIWSAFTAWTQSGNDRFLEPEKLQVLRDAMDWLERYTFDDEHGLFGRYYRCEDPFVGSRDAGFDNAIGKMTAANEVKYRGRNIRRSYDIYINQQSYASYLMLAAMHGDSPQGNDYADRARVLGEKIDRWFGGGLPPYGDVQDDQGRFMRPGAIGLDRCDYIWALSLCPFYPAPWKLAAVRRELLDEALQKPQGYFLAAYFSLLASLDVDEIAETDILRAVEYAAKQSYRPGEYLAMPNTIVEMLDMPDGDLYHDVRPQAFSIGPWLATMTGLGLRRLPFGLAVRANATLAKLSQYQFGDATLDVTWEGKGALAEVLVNNRPLRGTWQIPQKLLKPGKNTVRVQMGKALPTLPLLVDSTVRLLEVSVKKAATTYFIEGYNTNQLAFRNLQSSQVSITTEDGEAVQFERIEAGERTWLAFEGQGKFTVHVSNVAE